MKPKLIAQRRTSEFNYQEQMVSTLRSLGIFCEGETYQEGCQKNRFDVAIFTDKNSYQIIGIIEMKAKITGDMRLHEKEFWEGDQGKRYKQIGIDYGIPVLYCAGPSEINRVAKKMYRELYGWKAQLKRLFGF